MGGIKVLTGTVRGFLSALKCLPESSCLLSCAVPQVSSQPRLKHFSFPDPEEPPPSASLPSQPQAKVISPANALHLHSHVSGAQQICLIDGVLSD